MTPRISLSTRFGSLAAASLLLCAALVSCVGIPDEAKPIAMSTHVDDWRDEVIYQVLTDRFSNGDLNNDYRVQTGALARYQGGDFRGMSEHLDYLQELGVTALWISPIVKNVETDADVDAYHGYWAQDLTELNPHMGDLAALRTLSRAAHERGMKIILDIVTNHMGQAFFYDINLNGKPDINVGGNGVTSPITNVTEYDPDFDPRGVQARTSLGPAGRAPLIFIDDPSINRTPPKPGILGRAEGYHGLGRIYDYDDKVNNQTQLGDFPGGLKDVATENPEVRAIMIDSFARWVELADLDGFRIDTVKHVEHEFWEVFAKGVRERLAKGGKKKFFLFGEAFDGDDALLGSYTAPGQLDGVFYFSQHYSVYRDVFMNAHRPEQQGATQRIADLWAQRETNYGSEPQPGGIGISPQKSLVNFLDNHDVARFLFSSEGNKPALRNALTLLMTQDGIPCLYYGTEQEFAGGNDPANREVLWNTNFATGGDTFRHFSKLARLRRQYPALRRGDLKVVYSGEHTGDEADAGIFAFERSGGDAGDGYALIILNTNDRQESSTAFEGLPMRMSRAGVTLVDVLGPAGQSIVAGDDGELELTLPAQGAVILVPEDQRAAE